MKTNLKSYSLLILAISIGIILSLLIINSIKDVLPTDFIRTKTILKILENDSIKKDIVFFGSSVCMSAIDGTEIQKNSYGEVVNFGSFEQSIIESTCFYQYLDKSTKSVFQLISVEDLMKNEVHIPERVLKRLLFYNYEINNETSKLLIPCKSDSLNLNFFERLFFFRKTPIQSLMIFAHRALSTNQKQTNNIIKNEIQSPHYYTQNVSSEKLDRLINSYTPKTALKSFTPSKTKIDLIKINTAFFKSKNQKYTIIINPINPAIPNYTDEFKIDLKKKLESIEGSEIINLSTFLEADDFIDHVHINKKGRDKITEYLKPII